MEQIVSFREFRIMVLSVLHMSQQFTDSEVFATQSTGKDMEEIGKKMDRYLSMLQTRENLILCPEKDLTDEEERHNKMFAQSISLLANVASQLGVLTSEEIPEKIKALKLAAPQKKAAKNKKR